MKKMILSLAIAFTTLSAFAGSAVGKPMATEGDDNVNQKVLNAFKNDFINANDVEWTIANDYYKASFVYNDKYVFAYYNSDGELLGMTRYISTTDLPVNLQMNLKKKYNSYWVNDLFEVSKSDATSYYLTIENADTQIILKSTGGSEWSVFKTTKKA